MLKVVIVRHAPSHMLPDVLLGVQLRGVGRQLFQLNPVVVLLQQPENGFGLVRFVVVDKENDFALRVCRQIIGSRNGCQQAPKSNIVPTRMEHRYRLAGNGVHRPPGPALRRMHTGGQDDPLASNARPAAGDRRKQAHLGRISEEQDAFCIGLSFPLSDLFFSLRPSQGLAYA